MSKETYWKCDRCKRKALGAKLPDGWVETKLGELLTSSKDKLPQGDDLCAECHESFLRWWTAPDRDEKA